MSKCALCKTSLKDDEINVCDKCRLDFLNFKQQLAEKDKEIAELNVFHDLYLDPKEYCMQGIFKRIRKQICDEFKKAIIAESVFITEEEARYWTDDIDVKTILEIIDKIEKDG